MVVDDLEERWMKGDAMPRETVAVHGIHKTSGYSHGVRATGATLYIAGQIALDPTGTLVGKGDIIAQAAQVFENLKAVLASAGATFRDVVKLTVFTTDLAYRPKIAEVRGRYIAEEFPASTFLVISSLASPDYLLEIEAIAALP
jgi:reactive intermediate/imine deaminase